MIPLWIAVAASAGGCALVRAADSGGDESDGGEGGAPGADCADGQDCFALVADIEDLDTPVALAARDMAGDPAPDLAVLDVAADRAHLYVDRGDGELDDTSVAADAADLMFAGTYVSGDGAWPGRDLVYVSSTRQLVVVDGDGEGGLAPREPGLGVVPVVMTSVSDLGGGVEGLAQIDTAGAFMLLTPIGDGSFAAAPGPNPPVGPPTALAAADLDGNGTVDFLLGNGGKVYRSLTSPAGDRAAWEVIADLGVEGATVLGLATGHLTGDAALDLAVAASGVERPLRLYSGVGGAVVESTAIADPIQATSVAVGDANGDSLDDLLAFNAGGGAEPEVVVLVQGAGGTYAAGIALDTEPPAAVAVADFDADGRDDFALVTGSASDGVAQIWCSRLPPAE